MADDEFAAAAAPPRPTRLMNFVSEDQLAEARKSRGARVDDGTAQRDRPLYEILKENKDKKDAEFNERFKHRPPKALDEDESEFLDKLEMSRREYERQMADEEAQQLRSFQATIAAQSEVVHEVKETPPAPKVQEQKVVGSGRKNRPLGMNIIVKPQAKKAKTDTGSSEVSSDVVKSPCIDSGKPMGMVEKRNGVDDQTFVPSSLVSYSDESEDD